MTEAHATAGVNASQFLTERDAIERVFRIFRDQCSTVQLRFERGDECTAHVLEVRDGEFLLEDIRPRHGMRWMRDQEPFSLYGRVDGIYAHAAELRVRETREDRGLPYFVLRLPRELLFQQRRRAARFRLPLSVTKDGARITLHREERRLSGYLVDISAGGCRVVFNVKHDPQLRPDEVIERAEIEIPHLLSLTARAVLRHHLYNKENGQLACGIEFVEMPVRDRRRLEQFVAKIAKVADPA
jgi:hypothetical protein